ncbi:ZZ-type zinc finger-containing protein 3 [Leucoagaricus sp. SymC.cos]|nr:ZZ-type zinc finger-containing protein 3 [Leucoagaricus sp. SymC.cos]
MDQKRAQTLEALEAFIQNQKALLETTYSDIERLREARAAAIADPKTFLGNLQTNLDAPSFRLSALPDWQLVIPRGIDWSVFEGHDPAPLQRFTTEAQQSYAARNEPHSTQKSPLSDLQKLVKTARRSIIDPALAAFSHMPDTEDETESEIDEEEAHRQREREKIRLLKQRKIRTCGLKLPGLRMQGSTAVFVRHDAEDESMDVDISLDHDEANSQNNHVLSLPPESQPQSLPPKFSRSRRPTQKNLIVEDSLPNSRPRKKIRKDGVPKPPQLPPRPTEPSFINTKDTGKPKPETYKQAWSVSEQHLLEQLLEQIPEGEKYRWQKISRAMNGRRTPRQVASRVQKYFEKLKKYGMEGS